MKQLNIFGGIDEIDTTGKKIKKKREKHKVTSVNCGDWHKGWGFGGHDKLGKLHIEIVEDCPVNFIWRGKSQGRHGRTWNHGAMVRFMLTFRGLRITEQKGGYPDHDEILKAANTLLREHNLPELSEEKTEIYYEPTKNL